MATAAVDFVVSDASMQACDARVDGSLEFDRADTGRLAPGRYVARLMLDDGYTVIAETPFAIR